VHEIERLLAETGELRDAITAYAEVLAGHATASGTGGAEAPVTADQAAASVRAAQASVQGRSGGIRSAALSRLYLAQRRLADARSATDPADVQRLARASRDLAQEVLEMSGVPASTATSSLVGASSASRFAASPPVADGPIMFDPPSASGQTARRVYSDDGPSTGGKALWGGISGGIMGLVGGSAAADGEAGAIVLFAIAGVALGALFGAFAHGEGGGGSSSGWGGSSRSSYRSSSSHRSSSRTSSRSRSGGSRSSGRSGGRRF
jgi:hypothetical protein